MNVHPDVNFEELARSTDDFNGAQLKAVCVEAGMLALRRDATEVLSHTCPVSLSFRDPFFFLTCENLTCQQLFRKSFTKQALTKFLYWDGFENR